MTGVEEPELTWQEVVQAAEEGVCWLCPRTGFKKLSQHLALAHGMKADAVRERYGLAWTQPLATAAFRKWASDQMIYRPGMTEQPQKARRRPRRMQSQARASMREVANRANVKEGLRVRNGDPEYLPARAEGLRRSEKAAEQRAAARAKRWPQRHMETTQTDEPK